MFRQEEARFGGWNEKTIEHMQKRRFEMRIAQLPPLGSSRLENLSPAAFRRRLECCWQDFERKPMRAQQEAEIRQAVMKSIRQQADCLSGEEHNLVERALILGGSAQIEDAAELDAALALSLRLWASVGLVSGKPYVEIEPDLLCSVAKAFDTDAHDEMRFRFDMMHRGLASLLYQVGAMDDRQPQLRILRDVLHADAADEHALQLARRYLWASFDCFDYSEGVMLVHSAIAEPRYMLANLRRRTGLLAKNADPYVPALDILPQEIPLQQGLESAISGALREGLNAHDVARTLRFLCKQGAPLPAMEDVLQRSLIVYVNHAMRGALADMYYRMPKWVECSESASLQ